MNKVIISGRCARDWELKYTQKGTPVATNSIAVNRKTKNEQGKYDVDFIPVVVWNKPAETLVNYSGKGLKVEIAGRIETRSYTDKEGIKRYVTEVIAEDFEIVEWANSENKKQTQNNAQEEDNGFYPVDADVDEIPF